MSAGPGFILTIIGLIVAFALLRAIVGGRRRVAGALRLMIVLLAIGLPILFLTAHGDRPPRLPRPPRPARPPGASVIADKLQLNLDRPGPKRIAAQEISRAETRTGGADDRTDLGDEVSRLRYQFAYGLFDLEDALELKNLAGRLVQRLASAKLEEHWQELPPVVISHDDEIVVIGRGELQTAADVDEVLPSDDEAARQEWKKVEARAVESAAEQLADHLRRLEDSGDPALRDIQPRLAELSETAAGEIAARIIRQHAVSESDSRARRQRDGGAVLSLSSRFRIQRHALLSALRSELGSPATTLAEGERPTAETPLADARRTVDVTPTRSPSTPAAERGAGQRPALQGIRSAAIIILILIGSAAVLRASVGRSAAGE